MSCCGATTAAAVAVADNPETAATHVLSVPSISCGKCISTIERALATTPGVARVRVNLTLRRVTVALDPGHAVASVVDALDRLGYPATPIDSDDLTNATANGEAARLLRALAVAGFAAGNIMLLSVSVWSGATGPTRDLFHLVSALIAVPAVAYAGQPFFRSAWTALRARRLNMDVPISLAVLLALAMSVFETLNHGEDAFFDAAVTLLFFLLIGRYLDQRMRARARSAVVGLGHLTAKGAMQVTAGGGLSYVPVGDIAPDMVLRIRPGDRVPVDARIVAGTGDVDRSLVTGESAPVTMAPGHTLEAGTLNLNGALDVVALRCADKSFLAEVKNMLAAAECGRGDYVRIADRMARIYAPAVHLLALATFVAWLAATGDWQTSLYTAIAVLIITCPCALGLAVPVVHVVGAARLFEAGILMKDGTGLERLAAADRAVFDKTGTLTTGTPNVVAADIAAPAVARTLAAHSSHPAAQAVHRFLATHAERPVHDLRETPGSGIEATVDGKRARLGRAAWVAEITGQGTPAPEGLAFAVAGGTLAPIRLAETLRPDAAPAIAKLKDRGLAPRILSGDHPDAVAAVATQLGIADFDADQTPAGKIARIEDIHAAGHKVLMVGDGLNDAPSLAAGHVSMAPASAADVGRRAADFVYTRDSLDAVPFAKQIADRAARIVRQNFALAIAYNCIAVPLAMAGLVTPLVAAIAMSASSIVVIANAMRLMAGPKTRAARPRPLAVEAPA